MILNFPRKSKKKFRNVSIKLKKKNKFTLASFKGDKFEIKDNTFPDVSTQITIGGNSKIYNLRITNTPLGPTLSVASGRSKKRRKNDQSVKIKVKIKVKEHPKKDNLYNNFNRI